MISIVLVLESSARPVIRYTLLLGTRLMVGQQILDLYVGVRLLRPQPAPHRFHRPRGRFLFSGFRPASNTSSTSP